jgi:uncharacterized membrane protein
MEYFTNAGISLLLLLLPIISLLSGIVMGIAGRPKKINWWAGYRTPRSKKNQETWVFANRYAGKLLLLSGFTTLTFSVGILNIEDGYVVAWTFGAQMLSFVLAVILTEMALRKEFDKNGERKL